MTNQFDRGLASDELQAELRDLLTLAVVGDHVRWAVTGEGASEVAEWLAGAASRWRAWADQVAKHLASVGVAPDARMRSLAKDIPVHWVPEGWLRPDEAARLVVERRRPRRLGPLPTIAGDRPRHRAAARYRRLRLGGAGAGRTENDASFTGAGDCRSEPAVTGIVRKETRSR
jgi:hypothetical protein